MEYIRTDNAPKAIGPYSQAVVSNGLLFVSGQIPVNPTSGKIESANIEKQTEQALNNVKAIVEEAGLTLDNVVKTTCYLTNIRDFATFNAVYEGFFPNKPARACVEVAALPKGALVEVDVIASL